MSKSSDQDAHDKGEQDFSKCGGQADSNPIYEIFHPSYDPPTDHEEAYKSGWDNAKNQK